MTSTPSRASSPADSPRHLAGASHITILGAAGQIARQLATRLLTETDSHLTLVARGATTRLADLAAAHPGRVRLVDATFGDVPALTKALTGADVAYLNSMSDAADTASVLAALRAAGSPRLIGATIAGIEGEVPAELASWTDMMLPDSYQRGEGASARLVAGSELDHILLRLTWLFDDASDTTYELVPSGQPFADAEVSREAVVQAVLDILTDAGPAAGIEWNMSYGVGKPGTHYGKPSFY